MPYSEAYPIPYQIADFIREEIMFKELGETLFNLLTRGLGFSETTHSRLHERFNDLFGWYVNSLTDVGAARPGEFNRDVLQGFRDILEEEDFGGPVGKLVIRLTLKNRHIRNWIEIFFDYAIIARRFTEPKIAELRQASGELKKFFVVKMGSGDRKLLMYDLAARIMDADELPLNIIIVSSWARTGWNVIQPNLLIDATATRNVTAWQQLRGRAMRARKSWNKEAYEAMMLLLGSQIQEAEEAAKVLPADFIVPEDSQPKIDLTANLDENTKSLLTEIHTSAKDLLEPKSPGTPKPRDRILNKIKKGNLDAFTEEEKEQLAIELMLTRNKVTHIFELVKAYGSTTQVRLDRDSGKWRRKGNIALKHIHEYSVSPLSGEYGPGEAHAPMIYFGDPRENLPSKLKRHMIKELKGRDPLIVNGWINAVVSGIEEDLGLE
jgi:hypothetical protein